MTSQAHLPGPIPPSCPPTAPSLLLPAFPGAALLVTSADAPGSKLIIKLKREGPTAGSTEELPRTQTFFLTGMPLGWATPRPDGPSGPGIRTVLLTKAVEELGGRKSRVPETIPSARAPPPSDASFACTSKGVYENYRRWQRYKTLAKRHFPVTPDAEALACFFIPVLRSLARLRPDMTLEDGVPRAVQEWEHSSNFERMIFYEMAEKFMEFEAEEEQQIQKMKVLAGCSPFQVPTPKSVKPSPTTAAEPGQQQVYIPKKSASKSRQPRRRQRRPPSSSAPGAPREIPAEAVHQYAEIMEGLDTSWEEEEEDEKKEQGGCRDPQDQQDGIFPDPCLLQYIDQLCDDEEFVCKVEAIIHPQFMADLLSLESSQDPLDLIEELEEELNLTPNQLIEKRLLVLSEEEREPSVCPTSQSDSTPSQSEEEDEGSGGGGGKGEEEASCKAMKTTSPHKSIRTRLPELPGPVTASLFSPSSHQRWGERVFPPEVGRAPLSSSPLILRGLGSQEERALPAMKTRADRETQNVQKQNQAELHLGQAKGIQCHDQRGEINPNSLRRSLKSSEDKAGREMARPRSAECGRKDGRQGKVKGQGRVSRASEQNSHAAKPQFHEGTQPVRQNSEPAHKICGKQNGVLQGVVKLGKWAQAIGEREEPNPEEVDHANQNMKKTLSGDPFEERVVPLDLHGYGEQPFEKVIGQSQDIRGSKGTSSGTELDRQEAGLQSQMVTQINQHSEQLVPLECQKHGGGQQELLKDQAPFQDSWKGPKSAPSSAVSHCESTGPFGKSLAGEESRTSMLAGPGKQLDGHEVKVRLQKKPQLSREKTKKKSSSSKALRLYADNVAPSTSTGQDGPQPSCTLVLETDQKVNCPVFVPSVEPSGCKGNQLTLTDSVGVRAPEGQIPRLSTEQLLFSSSSGLESPSPSIQEDPSNTGKFPKAQWLLADQGKVTLWVGTPSDIRQTLNPTSNPSGCITVVEVDGGSCGPSGDHTPASSSGSKREPPLVPKLSLQVCSNCNENVPNQRSDIRNPLSPDDQSRAASLGSEVKEPGKVERRDVLPLAPGASAILSELSDGDAEGSHGAKEEEPMEDEELSSFSSLLASKLSLSSHCYHVPCPLEQEDMVPLSPTQAGKQGSKTRHSVQVQMPQDGNVLLSKNLGTYPTVHHKRKSNSLGTRKSKRLRNQ